MDHQWFCGGLDPCACMDSWKETELEKEAKSTDDAYLRRLESNVCKAISDDPAKPVLTPIGEKEFAEIKQRLRANPHYREMVERAAVEELEREAQPPACVHEWAFLRTRSEDAYFDNLGKRIEKGKGPIWSTRPSIPVDVFFCRRCLEYRTKGS